MRARFINEMSFASLDVKDVITKDLKNEWLSDDFLLDLFLYSYANEHGEDPEDLKENEFIETEEFRKWSEYEMESRYYETINKFNYNIIDGTNISIWRVMTVKDDWINHLEKFGGRLGIYWSWDKSAAEPHWGYNPTDKTISVLIESEVHINHIDWVDTIKLNMHPNYEEEKEIRLFKNTPLKIKSVEKDGEEIDVSNIQNKIFKA
jgi:hypothetical protein